MTDHCARCGVESEPHLLDAILLDAKGDRASDEAYCEACHPLVQKVPSDRWRPNHD